MDLTLWQWVLGGTAALLVGISKTGIPGVGILVVTLLAQAFGGWNSVGVMLPMLILGDVFAVAWYKRHAQWDKLVRLLPWVLVGVGGGAVALRFFGQNAGTKALLNPVIGGLVLLMLAMHLLGDRWGEHLTPRSRGGAVATGVAAGFATTVSNAAGPIMTIYLAAQQMPKEQFMGTLAWYFFLINLTKVPIYTAQGLFTGPSLLLDLYTAPIIILGVFVGRWLLPRFSENAFHATILILAAVGALRLLIPG
ncbi:MAG TPA: sulfite exporter TauE/SafE family protein [Armatimonadota bacterium]|jgi:hypothetical protein